jgi:ankyrin repeat protein
MVVIDAQNNRGDTPLHNATRWNDAQLVEQLIKEYVVLTFNRPR